MPRFDTAGKLAERTGFVVDRARTLAARAHYLAGARAAFAGEDDGVTDLTPETYLDAAPEPQRTTLVAMWSTLRRLLPDAEATMSYGVPTLKVGGKGVAGVAHYAKHCSYLPMSGSVTTTLAEQLAGHRTSKGAVMMAVDQPLADDLIAALVDARLAEIRTGR